MQLGWRSVFFFRKKNQTGNENKKKLKIKKNVKTKEKVNCYKKGSKKLRKLVSLLLWIFEKLKEKWKRNDLLQFEMKKIHSTEN